MKYAIEVIDTWGRRVATINDVPRLEVRRRTPDQPDELRGLLPTQLDQIGPGYTLRVNVDDSRLCELRVTRVAPAWGDVQKLIVDRYVSFHELLEVEAQREANAGNTRVSRAYMNREVSAIVRDVINRAPGALHYHVEHEGYPDGAVREWEKFDARRNLGDALEVGGISTGTWVDASHIDATGAYAKDGDTIAGLIVDGAAWPDLRLMMIDCEEASRNSHAMKRHPEVAFWTDAEYDASVFKQRADAATAALQSLLDTKGIDYIELNPHRNAAGEFDDRVDSFGRYLGLVFGGSECFNAAMVELGHAEAYLHEEGRFLVPELALKDFYSYSGVHEDSIEAAGVTLAELDVKAGALEAITALSYAAGGYIFDVDPQLGLRFRNASRPDRVLYFDARRMAVTLGSSKSGVRNLIFLTGNPVTGVLQKTYRRDESLETYGSEATAFDYFSVRLEADADQFAAGLLQDVAYPEPAGSIVIFRGNNSLQVGDLVELRGIPLRRYEPELSEEFGGRFSGKLVARVKELRHLFTGSDVTTTLLLGSPLRSVSEPLAYIVRSQEPATALFELRLDEATVGLDMGYHLD